MRFNFFVRFRISVQVLTLIVFMMHQETAICQSHIFAQLQGAPVNTSGWNLFGAAKVGNVTGASNGEVILCPAQVNQSGAVFFSQPINLSLCNKWISEFDLRIFDGTGADGIAFCFLDVPPSGYVNGSGLGIPASANGLKVCFDTYPNCTPINTSLYPKVELRWDLGYDECRSQPTATNSSGTLSSIRSGGYTHAKITYDNGNINVYLNNILCLTGFQLFNFPGYLGFTASTGGSTDNHSIKNVIIYADIPASEAGNNLTVCNGASQQLGTTTTTGYTYIWSPSTNLNQTNISNPTVANTNTTSTDIIQKYFVQTGFSAIPGCTSSDSVVVTFKKPVSTSRVSGKICAAGVYTLPSGKTVTSPGLYPDTVRGIAGCDSVIYQVDLARQDVIINSNSAIICKGQSYKLPWGAFVSDAGIYSDTIKYISGCDSLIRKFTITTRPLFTGNTNIYICAGQSYTLPWGTVANATGTYRDTTRYLAGCDSSIRIVNLTIQQVKRVLLNQSICAGQTYTLPSGNVVHQAGVYIDTLKSRLAGCDSIITTLTLDTNLKPVITLNKSNDINCISATAKLTATGGNKYLWSPAVSLNDSTIFNPVASPAVTTVYHAKVFSANGCFAEDSIRVMVSADLSQNIFLLPNAFTPNNDGINDCFGVSTWGHVTDLDFYIYNRWGGLVFHTKDPTFCWDGMANGVIQPQGAYIYKISATTICGFIKRSGAVMLIR